MRSSFDMDALRLRIGDKAFARGEAYHQEQRVRIASIDEDRILARVEGEETYRVELRGKGKKLEGQCSCPRFADVGLCKHMVATALAVNSLAANGFGADAAAVGVTSRIRAHLKTRGVDALIDLVMDLAERDEALFDRLDLAAVATSVDDPNLEKRLRKAIDKATEFDGYQGSGSWADGVETVLDTIAELVSQGRAAPALRLIDRALDQVADSLGSIDDSDGECADLLAHARNIHLAATRLVRPDPVTLARELYAREIEDEWGTFHDACTVYEDVLGPKGVAAYRQLAADAWAELPPLSPTAKTDYETEAFYRQLQSILDAFAGRDNDVEARIALRTKTLDSPHAYQRLIAFCREHGREVEALHWAEEGLFLFEDSRQDESFVKEATALLVRAGRAGDALARLQASFRKAPSLELYKALGEVGGATAKAEARRELESRLGVRTGGWQRLDELLITILSHEKMYDAAWAVARRPTTSPWLRLSLAKASEAAYPGEALEVYREEVEQLVAQASYDRANALISRMAKLRGKAEQAAYVADLKMRHARKRNLMKLLA